MRWRSDFPSKLSVTPSDAEFHFLSCTNEEEFPGKPFPLNNCRRDACLAEVLTKTNQRDAEVRSCNPKVNISYMGMSFCRLPAGTRLRRCQGKRGSSSGGTNEIELREGYFTEKSAR